MIKRTEKEIEDQLNEAGAIIAEGGSKVPGMSYEEGVDATIRWILGHEEDPPIESE